MLRGEAPDGKVFPIPVITNRWIGTPKPYAGVIIAPLMQGNDDEIVVVSRYQMRLGIGKPVLTLAQGFGSDNGMVLAKIASRELREEFGKGRIFPINHVHEGDDYLDRTLLVLAALVPDIKPESLDPGHSQGHEVFHLRGREDLKAMRKWQASRHDIATTTISALWCIEPLIEDAEFKFSRLEEVLIEAAKGFNPLALT